MQVVGVACEAMSQLIRIWADEDGESHLEDMDPEFAESDFVPPAPPVLLTDPEPAEAFMLERVPPGWYGDWHPTPVRQWLILMSGTCEFETGDGEKRVSRAGDVIMLDDLRGKGHQTRVIGDTPVGIAAIQFS